MPWELTQSWTARSILSSRKYKILEEPIEATVESFEDKILSVEPKTWVNKTTAERSRTTKLRSLKPRIQRQHRQVRDSRTNPGVVAEDLEAAGLEVFVRYHDDESESVKYDRIGLALIPIIRRLRDRVDALETQLGENK